MQEDLTYNQAKKFVKRAKYVCVYSHAMDCQVRVYKNEILNNFDNLAIRSPEGKIMVMTVDGDEDTIYIDTASDQ